MPKLSKHSARIAAVQIMYQLDMTNGSLDDAVSNFNQYYLETEDIHKNINKKFFEKLVSYFEKGTDFEAIISESLTEKSTLSTIVSTTLSVIKVAILEMLFESTDMAVIINEYVEVAKYFCDQRNVSFVNAILDNISKGIRK